jgi:hypothetical protein
VLSSPAYIGFSIVTHGRLGLHGLYLLGKALI